jgi:D-alanyl-lipoteichoic acid acyltransferase DltB (MBOAT superfamily)
MLFNSFEFLIFFPIVTLLYFMLGQRWRRWLLLIASCYFYLSFIPAYLLILFFLILIDYTAALLIEPRSGSQRKLFLILSLCANLIVLSFFKYFNFINDSLSHLFGWLGGSSWPVPYLSILLPIGLSFHTFQSIAYVIEVYRGRQRPERSLPSYALYVLFYPQLVAGPIERPQNLLHQFSEKHSFDYKRVTDGLKLMMWGMFKKVVIADRLAAAVSLVYDNPTAYKGLPLLMATYYFAIQIYCDFSGYSDIAIGAAQVMGFHLMENFKRPYHAASIAEFWKRWHISLSTWFRDYVLFSLGGNRRQSRFYGNILLTFVLSGLWHGANWTFVLWGALHGLYLVVAAWTTPLRKRLTRVIGLDQYPKLHKAIRIVITFHLVCFSWIMFRAHSLSDAAYIMRHIWSIEWVRGWRAIITPGVFVLDRVDLVIALAAVVAMEAVHLVQRRKQMRLFLADQPLLLRWAVYYALCYSIIFLGKFGEQQFIYFQF